MQDGIATHLGLGGIDLLDDRRVDIRKGDAHDDSCSLGCSSTDG
jgi:hypothetical protein